MNKPRVRMLDHEDAVALICPMPRSIEEAFVTRGVAKALAYALDHSREVFGETFDGLSIHAECHIAMTHFMAKCLVPDDWVSQLGRRSSCHTGCTVCSQIEHLGRMALEHEPVLYRRAGTKGMWTFGSASRSADTAHPAACDHVFGSSAMLLAISDIHGPLPIIWRAEPLPDGSNTEVLP